MWVLKSRFKAGLLVSMSATKVGVQRAYVGKESQVVWIGQFSQSLRPRCAFEETGNHDPSNYVINAYPHGKFVGKILSGYVHLQHDNLSMFFSYLWTIIWSFHTLQNQYLWERHSPLSGTHHRSYFHRRLKQRIINAQISHSRNFSSYWPLSTLLRGGVQPFFVDVFNWNVNSYVRKSL